MAALLHREATDVKYACCFVGEGMVMRQQRRQYAKLHGRVMDLSDRFASGQLSANGLLKRCAVVVPWKPADYSRLSEN